MTRMSMSFAVVLLAIGGARGDQLLGPFNALGITDHPVAVELDVSGVPAGPYAGFELTVTATTSYRDVRWRLTTPGLSVPLADPGVSPDSLEVPLPPTQTWAGSFTQTYMGGEPLTFITWNDQAGGAPFDWNGITITLISGEVPSALAPAALDVGVISASGVTLTGSLDSNGLRWVRFETSAVAAGACGTLRIDTRGSELSGGIYRNGNDAELALYTAAGLLVATHDDIDQYFGDLQAALVFGADEGVPVASLGDLAAGVYYLALAGFDADFGWSHFEVSRDSGVVGNYQINIRIDELAHDCNGNGQADVCDLVDGGSLDVNSSGVPDECEDCNGNGLFDDAEVSAGSVSDCNANAIPDECEWAGPVTRLFVDQNATGDGSGLSWVNAIPELADALAALPCGDVAEIWVAAGRYTPAPGMASRIRSFELVDGVALYGGFAGGETDLEQRDVEANETVLSGDLLGNDVADLAAGMSCVLEESNPPIGAPGSPCTPFDLDANEKVTIAELGLTENSQHVVTATGAGPTAVLDGFTLRSGYFQASSASVGAGLFVAGGSPTIRECTFEHNVAYTGGAVGQTSGGVTLDRCRLLNNFAYSPDTMSESWPNPRGGGMYVAGGNATITNSLLHANRSVVIYYMWDLRGVGGALHADGGESTVVNCTVVGNIAGSNEGGRSGGGAFVMGGVLHARNSIFWGNRLKTYVNEGETQGTQIEVTGGTLDASRCCVQFWSGSLGGTHNFGSPPRFVDVPGIDGIAGTADDDVRLTTGSRCVDAGSNGALPDPGIFTHDLTGVARFIDDPCTPDTGPGAAPIVDLGALEFNEHAGFAEDCDSDGLPDGCELAGTLVFGDAFNDATVDPLRWQTIGVAAIRAGTGNIDPPGALEVSHTGASNTLRSIPFDLHEHGSAVLDCWVQVFGPLLRISIEPDSGPATVLFEKSGGVPIKRWQRSVIAIPRALLVANVRVRIEGSGSAWVDDLRILGAAADCNANERPDACDIVAGTAEDFDGDSLISECDDDIDGDGFGNDLDLCDDSPPGLPVNADGGPRGDGDADCRVTLADHVLLQSCLASSGPTKEASSACTDVFDFNGDGFIDLEDFASLQRVIMH